MANMYDYVDLNSYKERINRLSDDLHNLKIDFQDFINESQILYDEVESDIAKNSNIFADEDDAANQIEQAIVNDLSAHVIAKDAIQYVQDHNRLIYEKNRLTTHPERLREIPLSLDIDQLIHMRDCAADCAVNRVFLNRKWG